jgi:hypothetical protein
MNTTTSDVRELPSATSTYLSVLTWLFTLFNSVRVLAYLPTLVAIFTSGDSSQHSLLTWVTWVGANATMAAWLYEHNGRHLNLRHRSSSWPTDFDTRFRLRRLNAARDRRSSGGQHGLLLQRPDDRNGSSPPVYEGQLPGRPAWTTGLRRRTSVPAGHVATQKCQSNGRQSMSAWRPGALRQGLSAVTRSAGDTSQKRRTAISTVVVMHIAELQALTATERVTLCPSCS